jgi:hypothetical protein
MNCNAATRDLTKRGEHWLFSRTLRWFSTERSIAQEVRIDCYWRLSVLAIPRSPLSHLRVCAEQSEAALSQKSSGRGNFGPSIETLFQKNRRLQDPGILPEIGG